MIAFECRASTVLFNLLSSRVEKGIYLLPANICPIVPLIFMKAKKLFEFIDISPHTLCMDEEILLKRWRMYPDRYAGLLFVRTYGMVHDISTLLSEIKKHNPSALVVDDRCLCPPNLSIELPPNTDVLLFSTGYGKYIDIGIGGYGVLSESTNYQSSKEHYDHSLNKKLTAAYKTAVLNQEPFIYEDGHWLETAPPPLSWTEYTSSVTAEYSKMYNHKSSINALYADALPEDIQLPAEYQDWRFNILVKDKKSILDLISNAGLFASSHYASLAGIFAQGNAPNAESLQAKIVNLFNDRYFDIDKAHRLVQVLLAHPKFLKSPQASIDHV